MDAVYISVQIGLNNSPIIIRHLDIRHGNTCAELEFLSPISSVIKRCQICKSASTTVSKKVICYYEKRSLNVSKRSEQLSFPTYVSAFADENIFCDFKENTITTDNTLRSFQFTRYSSNVKNPVNCFAMGETQDFLVVSIEIQSNSNNSKWREEKRVHWYEEDMHERTM
ncbi:hypothetical protein T08_778, partial [Trichinella sp. T8]